VIGDSHVNIITRQVDIHFFSAAMFVLKTGPFSLWKGRFES